MGTDQKWRRVGLCGHWTFLAVLLFTAWIAQAAAVAVGGLSVNNIMLTHSHLVDRIVTGCSPPLVPDHSAEQGRNVNVGTAFTALVWVFFRLFCAWRGHGLDNEYAHTIANRNRSRKSAKPRPKSKSSCFDFISRLRPARNPADLES